MTNHWGRGRIALGLAAMALIVGVLWMRVGVVATPKTVAIDLAVADHQGNITLEGVTNLADGAELDCLAVRRPADRSLGDELFGTSQATVQAGRLACLFDASDWPDGNYIVSVTFVPGRGQPEGVSELYGSSGEHLAGDLVMTDSDGAFVMREADIRLGD